MTETRVALVRSHLYPAAQSKLLASRIRHAGGLCVELNAGAAGTAEQARGCQVVVDSRAGHEWLWRCIKEGLLLPRPAEAEANSHACASASTDGQARKRQRRDTEQQQQQQEAEEPQGQQHDGQGHHRQEQQEQHQGEGLLLDQVMRMRFSKASSVNEDVVERLVELERYDRAVTREDDPRKGVRHEPLALARAAAVVRAWPVKLTAANVGEQALPFVGASTHRKIRAILETGTCDELEAHRRNEDVKNSKGGWRGVRGGKAIAVLRKAVGVGFETADQLFRAGFYTVRQVADALRGYDTDGAARLRGSSKLLRALGQPLAAGEKAPPDGWTPAGEWKTARLGVLRHDELVEDPVGPQAAKEMVVALKEGLANVCLDLDAGGWRIERVGGARRRGGTSKDADFLFTHPQLAKRQLPVTMRALCQWMEDEGRLLREVNHGRGGLGMHVTKAGQEGKAYDEQRLLRLCQGKHGDLGAGALDGHEKVFGVFRMSNGELKRVDYVLVPHDEWPFALLGWSSGRQWNRFFRHFCQTCKPKMCIDSHCLAVQSVSRYELVKFTPDGERIKTEQGIFEAVGLPYVAPEFRDCPS